MNASFILATAAALALGGGVPGAGATSPKQGGAAVVTFNNDLTTLDPHVGYDWQNWSVIKSIFDGLDGLQARHDRARARPRRKLHGLR